MRVAFLPVVCVLCLGLANGCKRDDMADQPRIKPLGADAFFANGAGARMPPPHTVPVDAPAEAEVTSWQNPSVATRFPFAITHKDLLRGQEEFDIYCAPCHGLVGDGEGMIPERGFTRPPSYHTERLRNATPAYFYNVMTNGIGAMFPYADRVTADDRWRIAAYIRALQLSQEASMQGGGTP
jgi:mono/diheme cytochrome c family protein